MKIIVSGASGDLGRRITHLLTESLDLADLILLTRRPARLADLRDSGADVRAADFDEPDSLAQAMQGGDVLMLISTLSIGRRAQQHSNAIDAAKAAGVRHIVYTSSLGIQPQSPSISAQEHHATEQLLRDSQLTFTLLRNGWYADVIPTLILPMALKTGSFVASTGEGHVAPVFKQDCARVATAVLRDPDRHANAVYEISGPDLISFADIARICSEVTGVSLGYEDVSHEEKLAIFDQMGVNRDYEEGMVSEQARGWASNEMITYEMAIRQHFSSICSHHVKLITGSPAMSFHEVVEYYRGVWEG